MERRSIILTCPHCGSRDEYQLNEYNQTTECTNCMRIFWVKDGIHTAPNSSKFKPFKGMPERTEAENAQYHDEMITEGLRRIVAWVEVDPSKDKVYNPKMDMTASIEYLQAFNAMCINTTSLSWVLGMIEFIGDIQQKMNEQLATAFTKMNAVEFYNWMRDTLRERKDKNYEVMMTLKDNIRTLEAFFAQPWPPENS